MVLWKERSKKRILSLASIQNVQMWAQSREVDLHCRRCVSNKSYFMTGEVDLNRLLGWTYIAGDAVVIKAQLLHDRRS